MDTKKAQELIEKHRNGSLSAEEEAMLESWYLQQADRESVSINKEQLLKSKQAIWNNLPVNRKIAKVVQFRLMVKIAAAAMAILAIGAFALYLKQKNTNIQKAAQLVKNDVKPGGNKAYLTLANGKMIALTGVANGQIASQAGISITKTANGQLIYKLSALQSQANSIFQFNTITTPHGGQWQVILPDGTKVWLNAASSLTYPVSFTALKNRRVQLSGEAYFEVAKDKMHPFIVHAANQDVTVLGTHFNINAYADEQYTKTTLLEGSVRVTPSSSVQKNKMQGFTPQMLKPGEQSVLNNGLIAVSSANTQAAIAWKNAMFYFQDDDLGIGAAYCNKPVI